MIRWIATAGAACPPEQSLDQCHKGIPGLNGRHRRAGNTAQLFSRHITNAIVSLHLPSSDFVGLNFPKLLNGAE